MSMSDLSLTTGLKSLDHVLRGILVGDNVVRVIDAEGVIISYWLFVES